MEGSFLEKNFLKYAVIFTEGSKGEAAYLLKEGRVEISKIIDNKKKVFAILKPISLFGEMAILLDDAKRTATAVALEDCKVVEIKEWDFHRYLEQSPPVIGKVIKVLVHRLKMSTQKSLRVPNLYQSMLYLIDLMAKHGTTTIDHMTLVSNAAQCLVTTADNIDNILTTIAQDGMIEFDSNESGEKLIKLVETEEFLGKAMERRKKAAAGGA